MGKGGTKQLNCVLELVKELAPTKEKAITKSQLRIEAGRRSRGISGSSINTCLEDLKREGKLKRTVKYIQPIDAYYAGHE